MAILLPRLTTDGKHNGTLILWHPEDIYWFAFPDEPSESLMALEKMKTGEELIEILKESSEHANLYVDMFDNKMEQAAPSWWEAGDDTAKIKTLYAFRLYLGPAWELLETDFHVVGFSTLDMIHILESDEWDLDMWQFNVPWMQVLTLNWTDIEETFDNRLEQLDASDG